MVGEFGGPGAGGGAIDPGGASVVSANSEVAAFVDFENIRYSTINSFGREPDPIAWRDKALKYGLMGVARAYADFLNVLVIDEQDRALVPRVEEIGVRAVVTDTIMHDLDAKTRLARVVLDAAGTGSAAR